MRKNERQHTGAALTARRAGEKWLANEAGTRGAVHALRSLQKGNAVALARQPDGAEGAVLCHALQSRVQK